MADPDKSWKAALLSNGRPLERSVLDRVLEVEGLLPQQTYSFDRIHPERGYVGHSVDLLASFSDQTRDLKVDLLIEAKYRNPSVRWLYREAYPQAPGGPKLRNWFSTTDDLVPVSFFDKVGVDEKETDYRFGFEPLEARRGSTKTEISSCDDGGRQLAYAVASRIADAALNSLRDGCIHVVIPISVTTAELRVFNQEPSMEAVHLAGSLNELTESVEVIAGRYPTRDLEAHILHRLLSKVPETKRNEYGPVFFDRGINGFSDLARKLALQIDGIYMVSSYEGIQDRLGRVIEFCQRAVRTHSRVRSIRFASSRVDATETSSTATG